MSEPDEVAWFFHDSPLQLDDPKAPLPTASVAAPTSPPLDGTGTPTQGGGNGNVGGETTKEIDEKDDTTDGGQPARKNSSSPAVFATTSYVGGVIPSPGWSAFNPSDNKHLLAAGENDQVTVGLNRLHLVSMSDMQIRPIYWTSGGLQSSNVHKASWFYKTTLTPAEPSLEDELKRAIQQVKPWTEEYLTELKASIGVPEALEKIKIPIEYTQTSDDPTKKPLKHQAIVVFAPCCQNRPNNNLSKEIKDEMQQLNKAFDEVKTLDHPTAYLLPPPSSYSMMALFDFGPTPVQLLGALLTGKTPPGTMLTVQRYFSWPIWKELNKLPHRPTDDITFEPRKIRQLVLVVHGIGQKLSDRMESFNFTYSINGFRIAVEEQARDDNLQPHLQDHTLVLPINWRKTVNFDDLKRNKEGSITSQQEAFTLQDITIQSIPAVRNIITDVMLDIPYYMSHYKSMLIDATVKEANRVYNLFCHYNPDFKKDGGMVNIVGHSLGSVIAMDILSRQPTNCETPSEEPKFDFNTSNLFLCGSPAAFFLLLENSRLYPRKLYDEQNESKDEGWARMLKRQQSKPPLPMYGCLAVDNIYNVYHYSDPVSNLLNPTVDPAYAATIETATLPTDKAFINTDGDGGGFFGSISNRIALGKKSFADLRKVMGEGTSNNTEDDPSSSSGSSANTPPLTHDLPSEVELETRDFDREYHAEEKMNLLNDNGQIDFMIPLTGTLENQYFSMLTAHSAYWENKDFARLVAVECGRARGEKNALKQYVAKKKQKS